MTLVGFCGMILINDYHFFYIMNELLPIFRVSNPSILNIFTDSKQVLFVLNDWNHLIY